MTKHIFVSFKGKWKKVALISTTVIVLVVVIVIAFISPIAKYVIEKYDYKILGRKIRMDWIYVNPFTGYARIHNLKVYEQDEDSIFVKAATATVDFEMLKLPFKTYEISGVSLQNADIRLEQTNSKINLDDIIQRFTPKDTLKKDTAKTHFNLLNIEIKDSRFFYIEHTVPVYYYITGLNIKSPGLRWDNDTMEFNVSFKNGMGTGDVKAYFGLNIKSLNYSTQAKMGKFDMDIINQYFQDISDFGVIRANVDADVGVNGNFKSKVALTTKGYLAINDFHFGKDEQDKNDYTSFKKVAINMISVSPLNYDYAVDTLAIIDPFFKYERYDSLDNLTRAFGVGAKNYKDVKASQSEGHFNLIVAIADFLKELGQNFLKSHYSAKKFALYNGNVAFNDFALQQKFGAAAVPLNILAENIDRDNPLLKVNLQSQIKPHGNLDVAFSVTPYNFSNFDINYGIDDIAIPDFNPYVITYTSFPLVRGTLSLKGNWQVRDSVIDSHNHLVIDAPKRGKRIKKKDTRWLPLPLILGIVVNPGNMIDYEIPIKGKLSDPKFKLKYIILDVLKNIVVKPPTSPYRAQVHQLENKVVKYHHFRWNTRQTELAKDEINYVTDIARFLHKNAEASIIVTPVAFGAREKEDILIYLAKKKYYKRIHNIKETQFTSDDSMAVEKMSMREPGFLAALDKTADPLMFTIQEKCGVWIDSNEVNAVYNNILKTRQRNFTRIFEIEDVMKQVKFKPQRTEAPRSGFSNYHIEYSADIPEKLEEAMEKLLDKPSSYITRRVKHQTPKAD